MIIELLRYQLKPGTVMAFANTMQQISAKLHADAGITILFHGAIESEPDGYLLARSFADLATMDRQLRQFYASSVWRNGPRQEIIDAIEHSERTIVRTEG
ncbi:MAG: hypothetical protein ABL912_03145 [Novosphingobium sp.]